MKDSTKDRGSINPYWCKEAREGGAVGLSKTHYHSLVLQEIFFFFRNRGPQSIPSFLQILMAEGAEGDDEFYRFTCN